MAINKENIKLGPCKVIFDYDAGPDDQIVFETTQGGVQLNYTETTRDTNIDQYGTTPVKRIITGRTVEVIVPFAEKDIGKMESIIPGSTLVVNATDPTKRRLDVSAAKVIDLLTIAKKLVLIPLAEGTTPEDWVTIPAAAPQSNLEYTYSYDNELITNVNFVGFPDDDSLIISFGDPDA